MFKMYKSGFSTEEDEKLLEEIKKYDILFDSRNKKFKDTECKNYIWKDISREIGKTVEETKKRWKNIRDSYFRNKRKRGSGSAATKKIKWHLTSHLSFLDTVRYQRGSTSNVTEMDSELSQERLMQKEEVTQDEDVSQHEEVEESNIPTTRSSKKRKRENMSSIFENNSKERQDPIKCLTSPNEKLLNMNKPEDDIDLFCRSIALSMKGLPKRGQNEAKLKILGVVAELEDKYSVLDEPAI